MGLYKNQHDGEKSTSPTLSGLPDRPQLVNVGRPNTKVTINQRQARNRKEVIKNDGEPVILVAKGQTLRRDSKPNNWSPR